MITWARDGEVVKVDDAEQLPRCAVVAAARHGPSDGNNETG